MEYSEIKFTKWKSLNSIFYTRGIHLLKMYQDGTIEMTNDENKTYRYETYDTQKTGNRCAFSIVNRNSNKVGTLVLTSNQKALLIFEGLNGIKLKM